MRKATLWALALAWLGGLGLAQQAPLDTGGLELLQRIPVGVTRFLAPPEARDVLTSLAHVALLQWDLEDVSAVVADPATGQEETRLGGEFGLLLEQELLALPPQAEGMLAEHVELVQLPGLTPTFDEDRYRLNLDDVEIELVLGRLLGRPEKGLSWGLVSVANQRFLRDEGAGGVLRLQELTFQSVRALFTRRDFAPNGRFLGGVVWEFEPGNPAPVSQRSL